MKLTTQGLATTEIFERLAAFRERDIDWRSGRTWGYIYDAGQEAADIAKRAYTMYLTENALDPTVYPSTLRMEMEIVAILADHLGGDRNVVGNFTSGGTESIMLAVKTARDWARSRGIAAPEMIVPNTAHAAFHKAAHYLGVKAVMVRVDTTTFKPDPAHYRAALTPNTALLVASAPSYAHGVVDPVREIAAIAQEAGVLCHVDGCMGGFLLPLFRKLGAPVTDFDFSVPGVTSISVDLHKYAFCAKGASLILHKNKDLRRHQIFAASDWTGYIIVNPTVQSTKSGGPLAAAWAVLHHFGEEGYLRIARDLLDATRRVVAGIDAMGDFRVMGNPEMCLVAVASDTVDVFAVADEMKTLGWYIQPQLGQDGCKENVHLSIGPSNIRWIDELLRDWRIAGDRVKSRPAPDVGALAAEAFAGIDPATLQPEQFQAMLQMAGLDGVGLPARMAEINHLLNGLPPKLAERLLIEYVNDLFVQPA